jgi:hypothetical protein
LDVDAARILYVDSASAESQVIRLRDRATGADVTVQDVGAAVRGRAYLTPSGAIFLRERAEFPFSTLFEWRNGALTDLGPAYSLRAEGDFAVYGTVGSETTVIRRNTVTGASITIATDASNDGMDVADDGDVVYWTFSTADVFRFTDAGGAVQISPNTGENLRPVTDGTNVVYARRTSSGPSGNLFETELFDGSTTTPLVPEHQADVEGGYAVNNGWIAFTKPGTAGQSQVWTRSPSGEERQVTTLGASSAIAALGPNGEVVTTADFGLSYQYLLPPYDAAPVDAGTGQSAIFVFVGDSLLKLQGNTVFEVGP